MRKILYAVLCSTFLTAPALAGIEEAVKSFEEKDFPQALSEFTYLADEGNPTAVYYLGKMYNEGLGVPQNKELALEYFKRADSAYNTEATVQLAKAFLADDQPENYKDLAIQYLKKAAYAGNAEALYMLGNIYAEGILVPKEYTYAFGYYLLGALKGDKKAQHQLSMCYFKGRGTTQDYENGLKWLSKSANQGYVLAQMDLANFRATDARLQNIPDAYAWYSIIAAYNTDDIGQEAAVQRDKLAGALKQTSVILEQQRKARDWRPISPEASVTKEEQLSTPKPLIPGFNDPDTIQKNLEQGETLLTDGSKYNITETMLKNAFEMDQFDAIEKAVEEAVQGGRKEAYAYYGDLLLMRRSLPEEAVKWYQKGAEINEPYAQYQLAKMYCEGTGVKMPNAVQCYAWLLQAEKQDAGGLKPAIEAAKTAVEAEATPEELEKGKLLADSFSSEVSKKTDKSGQNSNFNFF